MTFKGNFGYIFFIGFCLLLAFIAGRSQEGRGDPKPGQRESILDTNFIFVVEFVVTCFAFRIATM